MHLLQLVEHDTLPGGILLGRVDDGMGGGTHFGCGVLLKMRKYEKKLLHLQIYFCNICIYSFSRI